MTTLSSLEALADWLAEQAVDVTTWGRDGYKTVADLWAEHASGDTTFTGKPPRRAVRVVQLVIERDGRRLLELEQELQDGHRRRRPAQLPSEKLKRGESYVSGVLRCGVEELAVQTNEIMVGDLLETVEATAPSPSYPGLPTQYIFYRVEVAVDGLPNDDFWRENMAAAGTDPVRRHRFGWRESPSTDSDG